MTYLFHFQVSMRNKFKSIYMFDLLSLGHVKGFGQNTRDCLLCNDERVSQDLYFKLTKITMLV